MKITLYPFVEQRELLHLRTSLVLAQSLTDWDFVFKGSLGTICGKKEKEREKVKEEKNEV